MALLGSSWSLLGRSGPKMGPNMVPKLIKMLVKNLSKKIIKMGALLGSILGFSLYRDRRAKAFSTIDQIFQKFFFLFFFRFWSSLGASWEPSWASCGSLGRSLDPKMLKNLWFFKGFERAVFWSLKLLMGLCVHLGCFLGKSGPNMGYRYG